MKVIIETIPHKNQRYDTVGDWQWEPRMLGTTEDVLHIKVSDVGPWQHCMLIAIHELVEALACKQAGIYDTEVDRFDLNWKSDPGSEVWEPGDDPRAPYFAQHQIASAVERTVAVCLNVNWHSYEHSIDMIALTSPEVLG